jgi:hypothetical protein
MLLPGAANVLRTVATLSARRVMASVSRGRRTASVLRIAATPIVLARIVPARIVPPVMVSVRRTVGTLTARPVMASVSRGRKMANVPLTAATPTVRRVPRVMVSARRIAETRIVPRVMVSARRIAGTLTARRVMVSVSRGPRTVSVPLTAATLIVPPARPVMASVSRGPRTASVPRTAATLIDPSVRPVMVSVSRGPRTVSVPPTAATPTVRHVPPAMVSVLPTGATLTVRREVANAPLTAAAQTAPRRAANASPGRRTALGRNDGAQLRATENANCGRAKALQPAVTGMPASKKRR